MLLLHATAQKLTDRIYCFVYGELPAIRICKLANYWNGCEHDTDYCTTMTRLSAIAEEEPQQRREAVHHSAIPER